MTSKRSYLTLTLVFAVILAVAVSTGLLRAQSPAAEQESAGFCDWWCQQRERQAQRLEGSWIHTVTPVLPPGVTPPQLRASLTFARGGALIGSDRSRPFDNAQHGTWEYLGNNHFAWTLLQDRFDVTGAFQGTLKVRTRATLTGRDTFVTVSSIEVRDAAGNVTLARCATGKGDRIKVEPLTPECQTVTPPQ